jgi:hypothetical protein
MPDQHAREIYQPLRNTSGFHQLAGENEEGDGEQRKIIDAAEYATGDDSQRSTLDEPQPGERGGSKCECDRYARQNERKEEGQ